MAFVSFPIAHSPHPVNHLSYVSYLTLLLPQDDTPDVIPRHAMLRHTYHVSATRNFRLTPNPSSGLSSLASSSFVCIPASMCSASRAGETRDRAERGSKAAKRMSTPHPRPAHGPIPTHVFHVKHASIIRAHNQERERELDMRPGCPLLRRGLRSLRSLRRRRLCARKEFATHLFHVKPTSIVHSPARAPVLLSCPRSERSGPALTLTTRPTQNETQNTLPDCPFPLTPTRPRSTFIPVSKEHGPPTERNRS